MFPCSRLCLPCRMEPCLLFAVLSFFTASLLMVRLGFLRVCVVSSLQNVFVCLLLCVLLSRSPKLKLFSLLTFLALFPASVFSFLLIVFRLHADSSLQSVFVFLLSCNMLHIPCKMKSLRCSIVSVSSLRVSSVFYLVSSVFVFLFLLRNLF